MNYVKKIDAMRAFAVLMVVMSHWIPKTSKLIPIGEIGVDIFFVISGFLITSILLTEREKAIRDHKPSITVLKNFISRRALRIFPVYYFALIVFWYLQDFQGYRLRENLIYYVTYTSNILFFMQNAWDGYLAPLWSLAVEEQFYLVWPLLMVLLPQKHTLKVIIGSIVIGFVFPYFFEQEMSKVLTPSCMNALGSGALLAWLNIKRPELLVRYKSIFLGIALLSLLFIFLSNTTQLFGFLLHNQVRMFVSVLSFVWIMYCIGIYSTFKPLEFIMNNSVLIFIGQISYGIYLYHNIISIVWRNFIVGQLQFGDANMSASLTNGLLLITEFVLLVLVSWISYRVIEKPFLSLKKYFVLD